MARSVTGNTWLGQLSGPRRSGSGCLRDPQSDAVCVSQGTQQGFALSWLGRGQAREEAELRAASLQRVGDHRDAGPRRAPGDLGHRAWGEAGGSTKVPVCTRGAARRPSLVSLGSFGCKGWYQPAQSCSALPSWSSAAADCRDAEITRCSQARARMLWEALMGATSIPRERGQAGRWGEDNQSVGLLLGRGLKHRQAGDVPCRREASWSCVFKCSRGQRRSPAAARSYL